jgi:hypothetical protein
MAIEESKTDKLIVLLLKSTSPLVVTFNGVNVNVKTGIGVGRYK